MRSQVAQRLARGSISISAVPPPLSSSEYSSRLSELSQRILYVSPLPSQDGLPIYILNAAAFPDPKEVDYDSLLPYVLARLPADEELLSGQRYEVVFFAGGGGDGPTAVKKGRPGWGWFVQAYGILSRAMRKRLDKLYIVHERAWVRVLVEMFSTIVSPKSRKKIIHVTTLSGLAIYLPIDDLLIPPCVYVHDRRLTREIDVPYCKDRRTFGAGQALPLNADGGWRLPRVIRETTAFVLLAENIDTEGIFRIPARATVLDILREAFDRGQRFIAWKEGDTVLEQPWNGSVDFTRTARGMHQEDCYGVHVAASLIKLWYSKLREPLVPQSAYRDLRNLFGDEETALNSDRLTDFLSSESQWSNLTLVSRLILTQHLLPFLSRVTDHQAKNKMTASNLAVCFAPLLLRGSDPMEDARMVPVIRRVLEAAIQQWNNTLSQSCKIEASELGKLLEHPSREEEYEDPPDGPQPGPTRQRAGFEKLDDQFAGITLEDRETPSQAPSGPPLPPRPTAAASQTQASVSGAVRRKPAPAPAELPRYSVMFGSRPPAHDESLQDEGDHALESVSDGFGGYAASRQNSSEETPSYYPSADSKANVQDEKNEKGETATEPSADHDTGAEAIKRKPIAPTVPASSSGIRAGTVALPGLTGASAFQTMTEASNAVPPSRRPRVSDPPPFISAPHHRSSVSGSGIIGTATGSTASETASGSGVFIKPTWPASARSTSNPVPKPPTLLNLAKPIQPSPATASFSSSPSPGSLSASPLTAPLPHVFPHTRTPSPILAQRFQPQLPQRTMSDIGPRQPPPRRLKLGDGSVDGLRRLYEERVGAARTLTEAGRNKS
ncbi:MAG: hypothetical protein M1825_006297 [Sarcosagium campestre]|nr:MAG: hypothetical protein M1825_006297 [Sarcosagium campestre]